MPCIIIIRKGIGERVNRVLEVDLDGEDMTLTIFDVPWDMA